MLWALGQEEEGCYCGTIMQLRSGALAGGSRGQLQAAARPAFEEGVSLVFRRWTALLLALEGQWGGSSSGDKAQAIYEETLEWFYKAQGVPPLACMQCAACTSREGTRSIHVHACSSLRSKDRLLHALAPCGVPAGVQCTKPCMTRREALPADHYADDLGLDLEDAFEQDFNAKLEDGSPYEVHALSLQQEPELLCDLQSLGAHGSSNTGSLLPECMHLPTAGGQGAGAAAQRAPAGQLRDAGSAARLSPCQHV